MNITRYEELVKYLNEGYALLALEPNGKAPHRALTPHGARSATLDPEEVSHWGDSPNVGLLPPAEVLVLDFDELEAERHYLATYPVLRAAPRQRTQSGGSHVFLRLRAEAIGTLPVAAGRIAGLDLRGMDKAYIAVEPSTINGRSYRWEVPLIAPDLLPLCPDTLYTELRAACGGPSAAYTSPVREPAAGVTDPAGREEAMARLSGMLSKIAIAAEGTRNDTLNRYAYTVGGFVAGGLLDEGEAFEALVRAGLSAGLEQHEVIATVRSGLSGGIRAPLAIERSPNIRFLPPTGTVGATPAQKPRGRGGDKPTRPELYEEHINNVWGSVVSELWHSQDGTLYATTDRGEWPLRDGAPLSRTFASLFYMGKVAGREAKAFNQVLEGVIDTKRAGEWPKYTLYNRIADIDGVLYLWLGPNRIVTVDNEGNIGRTDQTPQGVKFRHSGELPDPLDVPEQDAETQLMRLFDFIDVAGEDQLKLLLALFTWFFPSGPQLWLNLVGPAGAGKSTAARILTKLIEPQELLTKQPNENAYLSKGLRWVLAYDNVDRNSEVLEDVVCTSATHSVHEKRVLYTDATRQSMDISGGGIITSLVPLFTRHDTLQRVMVVDFPARGRHRDDSELMAEVTEAVPSILGGLLRLIAMARRQLAAKGTYTGPMVTRMVAAESAARYVLPSCAQELAELSEGLAASAAEAALESEPLIKAIVATYAAELKKGGFTAMTREMLDNITSAEMWRWYTRRDRIPQDPRALGIRLAERGNGFTAIGVKAERVHTERGNAWSFSVVDRELLSDYLREIDEQLLAEKDRRGNWS